MGNEFGSIFKMISIEEARERLPGDELRYFQKGYKRLCKANSSYGIFAIEYTTFKTVLLADFPDFPETLCKRFFKVINVKDAKGITIDEFLCALCIAARGKIEEKLLLLCAIYDSNETGILTKNQMEYYADLLNDKRLTSEEHFSCQALIEEVFCKFGKERDSLHISQIDKQDLIRNITKYMHAPLISWITSVGQSLLEPLFQNENKILISPYSPFSPISNSGFSESNSPINDIATTPRTIKENTNSGQIKPRRGSSVRFKDEDEISKISIENEEHFPNNNDNNIEQNPPKNVNKSRHHIKKYQSSCSQLQEGALFKQVYVSAKEKLIPGEHWFILNKEWFIKWKIYSGISLNDNNDDVQHDLLNLEPKESTRPGPIDNRKLLKSSKIRSYDLEMFEDFEESDVQEAENFFDLRSDLHSDDYILLNRKSWELLHKIYGGGPVLKREVISLLDNNSKGQEIELFPITLNIRCVAISSDDRHDIGFLLSPIEKEEMNRNSSTKKKIIASKQILISNLIQMILEACILGGDNTSTTSIVRKSNSSLSSSTSTMVDSSEDLEISTEMTEFSNGKITVVVPNKRIRIWCIYGNSKCSSSSSSYAKNNNGYDDIFDRAIHFQRESRRKSIKAQLLSNHSLSIEDVNLEDGQTIILEISSADGCWPLAIANIGFISLPENKPEKENEEDPIQPQYDGKNRKLLLLGGGRHKGDDNNGSSSSAAKSKNNSAINTINKNSKIKQSRSTGDLNFNLKRNKHELHVITKACDFDEYKFKDKFSKSSSARSLKSNYNGYSPSPISALSEKISSVGFTNLGNTCFMNAALQCLLHVDILRQYFLSGTYALDINKSGKDGLLADAFADLVRRTDPTYCFHQQSIAPRRFKKEIAKFDNRFIGYEQQDASEFLEAVLNGLSEDLNRIKSKAYTELKDSNGRADSIVASEWWENHLRRELNIITAIFTGQFKSLLECSDCGYQSARFDPYSIISLPLPDSSYRTIRIKVMFCDYVRSPLVCAVRVKKEGIIGDIKKALLDLNPGCDINVNNSVSPKFQNNEKNAQKNALGPKMVSLNSNNTCLAIIFDRKIQYILNEKFLEKSVKLLNDKVTIFAFQIPVIHKFNKYSSIDSSKSDINNIHNGSQALFLPNGATTLKTKKPQVDKTNDIADGDFSDGESDGNILAIVQQIDEKNGIAEIQFQPNGSYVPKMIKTSIKNLKVKAMNKLLLKLEQRQWHRHTCYFLNPFRITSVGHPFVLNIFPDRLTGRGLYEIVAKQVGGIEMSSLDFDKEKITSEEQILSTFGFKLVPIVGPKGTCRKCSWYKSCTGCPIFPDSKLISLCRLNEGASIAIDWGLASSSAHEKIALSTEVPDTHESIEECWKLETKPIQLASLIERFSAKEELRDVNCEKCKDRKSHTKAIQLWRAPPVLIIHLKRFQHSSYRHRKLTNLVDFPVYNLDLSKYIAESMPELSKTTDQEQFQFKKKDGKSSQDDETNSSIDNDDDINDNFQTQECTVSQPKTFASNDENIFDSKIDKQEAHQNKSELLLKQRVREEEAAFQEQHKKEVEDLINSEYVGIKSYGGHKQHGKIKPIYDLCAVVNHSGNLRSGHYVASVYNTSESIWYNFDDKVVSPIDESDLISPNSYILFYTRRDVQAPNANIEDVFPCQQLDEKALELKLKELNCRGSTVTIDGSNMTQNNNKCSLM